MTLALTSAHEWRISTQARGEVLTASARAEGCQFLVLGLPGAITQTEIEGWLGDLLGVAAESTRTDPHARPIPPLLHHALTGLLFSHREVWNAGPPDSTLSLAFVHAGDEVAFGWVGAGTPQVWIDGVPASAEWVRVRDHEGREAHALRVAAGATVHVSLDWAARAGDPGSAGVQVDAEWGGEVVAPSQAEDTEPDAAPFTIAEVANEWSATRAGETVLHEPPGAGGEASGPLAVPAMVASGAAAPETADAPPEMPELIPPSPEPADLTARAMSSRVAAEPPLAVEDHARQDTPPPAADDSVRQDAPSATRAKEARSAPATTAREDERLSAPALPSDAPEVRAPAAKPRPRMRPAWPTERELARSRRRGAGPWLWLAGAAVLVAGTWATGLVPGFGPGAKGPALALPLFGGARFKLAVDSRPPGAWIAAGGKDLAVRTPATIELPAGEHEITLSFPDLGSAAFTVRGARGDRQTLSPPLWGSLAVRDADASVPIAVDLDGTRVGYVPVTLDSLAPGAHELRFSGPGLTPWGQALRVRVGELSEVIARPMTTPAIGVLEVRATYTDGEGTNALEGAGVWVDGERRGVTPLVLELPRGPHSARVEFRGESTPIQVIDLPGGNQRFASFELGVNADLPTLVPAALPSPMPLGRPTVASASLDGVSAGDLREMWLHVREPDGLWRRYQMMMLKAPGGVVGVAVFPTALFDARGVTRYYMSAVTQTGDEYFTDIHTARSVARQAPAP